MSTQKGRKSFKSQFDPLPTMNQDPSEIEEKPDLLVRVSTLMNESLLESMKDYCYWSGLSQQLLIEKSVNEFLNTKEIKPRPDAVKARPKTGRKRTM
jgi:hypothetical protein